MMTEQEYNVIINRQRRLPGQICHARNKLSMLLAEADKNGMTADILHKQFRGDLVAMEIARGHQHHVVAGITAGLI